MKYYTTPYFTLKIREFGRRGVLPFHGHCLCGSGHAKNSPFIVHNVTREKGQVYMFLSWLFSGEGCELIECKMLVINNGKKDCFSLELVESRPLLCCTSQPNKSD